MQSRSLSVCSNFLDQWLHKKKEERGSPTDSTDDMSKEINSEGEAETSITDPSPCEYFEGCTKCSPILISGLKVTFSWEGKMYSPQSAINIALLNLSTVLVFSAWSLLCILLILLTASSSWIGHKRTILTFWISSRMRLSYHIAN